MTVVDQFAAYKAIVQGSFKNALGTVERVQQTIAETSVDLLTELGLCPADKAAHLKRTHQ